MKYLNSINKKYKLPLIIIETILFSLLLYYIDKYNLAALKLVNLYSNNINLFYVVVAILLIIFLSICFYLFKNINKKDLNYCDKLLILSFLVILIYIIIYVKFIISYKLVSYLLLLINLLLIIYRSNKLNKKTQ